MQNGEIRRCSKAQSTLFNLFSFAKIFTAIILRCYAGAQKMSREWHINNSYSISHSSVHPSNGIVSVSIPMDLVVCNSVKVVLLLHLLNVVPSSAGGVLGSLCFLFLVSHSVNEKFYTRINSISRITKHPSVHAEIHPSEYVAKYHHRSSSYEALQKSHFSD